MNTNLMIVKGSLITGTVIVLSSCNLQLCEASIFFTVPDALKSLTEGKVVD